MQGTYMAKLSLRTPGLARDVIPVAAGALVGAGVPTAVRAFVDPTANPQVFVWAPAIGAAASLLAAGLIYAMGGKGPAIATGAAGVLSAGAVFASDMISAKVVGANAVIAQQYSPAPALHGIANLAAVVPEYSKQLMGILWESQGQGVRGLERNVGMGHDKVALRGVSPSAFGTKSFEHS
jgi:hypothetical protein